MKCWLLLRVAYPKRRLLSELGVEEGGREGEGKGLLL